MSDIYSLGVTLLRLINNQQDLLCPYTNDKPTWIKEVRKERFPERKYSGHVPQKVARVINRAMKADHTKRYQSCQELRQALEAIVLKMEWVKVSDAQWTGVQGDDNFRIERTHHRSGYKVQLTKNNRRSGRYIWERIKTEHEANDIINDFIKEKTTEEL